MRHAKATRSRVTWLSYVAMAFMIGVSMIAGLGQSINLFPEIDPLWTEMIGYGLSTDGWHDPVAFLRQHGADNNPAPFGPPKTKRSGT